MFAELINKPPSGGTQNFTFPEIKNLYFKHLEEHIIKSNIDTNDANLRFSTCMKVSKMVNKSIAVIGCGGIGTHVIKNIAGMGAKNLNIFDNDTVEIHNIGPQNF